MKATKIFFGEERLKDVYVGATRFQVFKYKARKIAIRVFRLSFVASLAYGAFMAGLYLSPVTSYATVEVQKLVEVSNSPVMDRIQKCESPTGHFDKNGQVVVRGNSDKSVDVGAYQINMKYWGEKATALGLNLFDQEDNHTFAMYLYKNFGTEPWVHSKPCWNK